MVFIYCSSLTLTDSTLSLSLSSFVSHSVCTSCITLLSMSVTQMEYRMAVRQVAHEDFIEGVRAALVDKDRRPAWLTATTHPSTSATASAVAVDGPVQQQQQQQCTTAGSNSQSTLSTPSPPSAAQPLYGEGPGEALPGNRFSVQHLFSPLSGRQP